MEPSFQLTDIADAIRLAVTPIFLLAGVSITVNILITRLGRIVDRARVLESQQPSAGARQLRVTAHHAQVGSVGCDDRVGAARLAAQIKAPVHRTVHRHCVERSRTGPVSFSPKRGTMNPPITARSSSPRV